MKKTRLALESITVDSFSTGESGRREAGTVWAAERPCTSWNTCQCPTSPYICGTFPPTGGSCPDTSLC